MKEEIKEILEYLKIENGTIGSELSYEETHLLLDYITNLQEENERLKQPQVFIDTMDMEERYGQELYEDYLKEQLEDYKSRIDEAIEILESDNQDAYLVYKILKGEDTNVKD